jgi:N-carbamoyl-L-amino-acid hydrolase
MVTVDYVGIVVVLKRSKRTDIARIAIGNHLDTPPAGGKFAGVLGVLGGLEIMCTLHDLGYGTNAPLALLKWTNEEGPRFIPAMLGSRFHADTFDRAYAESREGHQVTTSADVIERIGYSGETAPRSVKFCAMSELHIEQDPLLEAEQKVIDVLTGAQGMRWYEIKLPRHEAHTRSSPMNI